MGKMLEKRGDFSCILVGQRGSLVARMWDLLAGSAMTVEFDIRLRCNNVHIHVLYIHNGRYRSEIMTWRLMKQN